MNKVLIVVGLIVGVLLGFFCFKFGKNIGYSQGFAKCSEVTIGKEVVRDTIIKHDTIQTLKSVKDIVVHAYTETVTVTAREVGDSVCQVDSGHCYAMRDTQNSVQLYAEMCSRFFPAIPPLDLHGSIKAILGNDTIHNIYRIDTLRLPCIKIPWYRDNKVWTIVGLSVLVAAETYFNLNKK